MCHTLLLNSALNSFPALMILYSPRLLQIRGSFLNLKKTSFPFYFSLYSWKYSCWFTACFLPIFTAFCSLCCRFSSLVISKACYPWLLTPHLQFTQMTALLLQNSLADHPKIMQIYWASLLVPSVGSSLIVSSPLSCSPLPRCMLTDLDVWHFSGFNTTMQPFSYHLRCSNGLSWWLHSHPYINFNLMCKNKVLPS